MSDQEVLQVELLPGVQNRMAKNCGVPPELDLSHPTGYFENDYGEQGLMQFDLETGICRVWMGDCGWSREIRVEELRGHILIRYLESSRDEGWEPPPEIFGKPWPEFLKEQRAAFEMHFGKLTDEEFNRVLCCFPVRPEERRAIEEFYEKNLKARERLLRKRKKEEEREAEAVRRRQFQEQKRAERERLWAEGRERRRQEIERGIDKQEVEEVKEKIRQVKRLLRGESDVDPGPEQRQPKQGAPNVED